MNIFKMGDGIPIAGPHDEGTDESPHARIEAGLNPKRASVSSVKR